MTKASEPLFDTVALIGIGLIGSSLAHACRQENLARKISISTRSQETLDKAEALGLGDRYSINMVEAVKGADLVILCVPVGACGAIAEAICPHLDEGTILTDVGSVKGSVIEQIKPHLKPGTQLIPCHPIAGTEHSGPESGFASLFRNRWCILTPVENSEPDAVEKLKSFWEACGSSVDVMSSQHHDMVLAMTSHIPHLIAFNIVGTADDLESVTQSEVIKYSAGGFRDFTRIAASDPEMWRDVFLHNKDAVLDALGRFSEDLSALQRAIRWEDGDTLFKLFSHTRDIRRQIIDIGQETAVSNFGRDELEQESGSGDQ